MEDSRFYLCELTDKWSCKKIFSVADETLYNGSFKQLVIIPPSVPRFADPLWISYKLQKSVLIVKPST